MHTNKEMDWQRIMIAAVDMLLQTPSAPNGGLSLPNLALNDYCWLPERWKKYHHLSWAEM